MKRIICLCICGVLLVGCSSGTGDMDRVLTLRSKLLAASSCTFDIQVTADYGDKTFQFAMQCQGDSKGNVSFAVTEPSTIAGISGKVSQGMGALVFDDKALAFDLLADGLLNPVSAPWVMLKALRSGYITSCGKEGELTRVTIDDSYEQEAFTVDIWLDGQDIPIQAQILWKGRKILTISLRSFEVL